MEINLFSWCVHSCAEEMEWGKLREFTRSKMTGNASALLFALFLDLVKSQIKSKDQCHTQR